MLNKLRDFLQKSSTEVENNTGFDASDKQLAQAALMFHVIAADGIVHDEERTRMLKVLESQYGLRSEHALQLLEEARLANLEAIDLYRFTSTLKRQLDHSERLALIENLWEMVYADGEIHELEDNVVWRVAELLAIEKRERMELKRKVRDNASAARAEL